MPCVLLEFQTRLAGCVCERLDPTVIGVSAAIEDDRRNAGLLGALGDQLADLGRGRPVASGLQLVADILIQRRGMGEGEALLIVDDLGVDVLARPEHRKPWQAAGVPTQARASAPLPAF